MSFIAHIGGYQGKQGPLISWEETCSHDFQYIGRISWLWPDFTSLRFWRQLTGFYSFSSILMKFWPNFTILTRYQSAFVIKYQERRERQDNGKTWRQGKQERQGQRGRENFDGYFSNEILYQYFCTLRILVSTVISKVIVPHWSHFWAQLMHHARCQWKWCRIFIQL